jgi:hypothetical protein
MCWDLNSLATNYVEQSLGTTTIALLGHSSAYLLGLALSLNGSNSWIQ